MGASSDPPLDEIQWRSPMVQQMQGVRSNTVLFYFAESPFFDRTSNNAVLTHQAMFNSAMFRVLETRDAFEARLRTMAGLEFVVAQEPASDSTVWVVRRQTRHKPATAASDDDDDVTVHAAYFVVGENIYMAPTLADVLAARVDHMTTMIAKTLRAADAVKVWSTAAGHRYKLPASTAAAVGANTGAAPSPSHAVDPKSGPTAEFDRIAEESFQIHMRYGGDYVDENPITGKPGDFHLSSTGRRERAAPPPPLLPLLPTDSRGGIGAMRGDQAAAASDAKKDGAKTPRTPTMPKPKRRKSKIAAATTPG